MDVCSSAKICIFGAQIHLKETLMADVMENVESGVKLDISALENELNTSDWARGWEQGRIDALKAIREDLLPSNDRVLRSAELVSRIMTQRFGNVFARIFAGFNSHYDEPAVLLCMNENAKCTRGDVIMFGVELQPLFSQSGLVPLRVLVTKMSSTDFGTVANDFQFERK